MRGPPHPAILIATIGSKPQVVTTALDLLLRDGVTPAEVWLPHTGGGPVAQSLARLRAEFDTFPDYQAIPLKTIPLAGRHGPLADTATQADAEDAFRGLYRLMLDAKRTDPTHRLHLSLVGGRKVLAAYALAAAQLLFDDDDCVWYVLAGEAFAASSALHPAQGDEVRLAPLPIPRWSGIAPAFTAVGALDDPFDALELQRRRRISLALDEARSFVLGVLTAGERRVAALLARDGESDAQIANRLGVSPATVGTHLEHIYRKARDHWQLPAVNRSQLVGLLNLYYTLTG